MKSGYSSFNNLCESEYNIFYFSWYTKKGFYLLLQINFESSRTISKDMVALLLVLHSRSKIKMNSANICHSEF